MEKISRSLKVSVEFIFIVLAFYFFILPGMTCLHYLNDPGLKKPEIPRFAFFAHKQLSQKFANWAIERVKSGKALYVDPEYCAGTEWPMFSCMFYLAATKNLQDAWEKNKGISLPDMSPAEYAKKAIDAACNLALDEGNAHWIKTKWGENYLNNENVFYRYLLISCMTNHYILTKSLQHFDLLRQQTDSLAGELMNASYHILDDYPGECYPSDVLWAIAAIRAADKILGTDHSALVEKAKADFTDTLLDKYGLLPYRIDSRTGQAAGNLYFDSRGCSNSAFLIYAPEVYPEKCKEWFKLYVKHFWLEKGLFCGFTEFPKNQDISWYSDVDSGPVVFGYGPAACAFGIGASRANGRYDKALPLSALGIIASWPLPDGTLLIPRLLSYASGAPYLGEAAILFNYTRLPVRDMLIHQAGEIPLLVFILASFYFIFPLILVMEIPSRLLKTFLILFRSPGIYLERGKSLRVLKEKVFSITSIRWITCALLLGLPFLGILIEGYSPEKYLQFPPLTQYVNQYPFSWTGFAFFTSLIIMFLLACVLFPLSYNRRKSSNAFPVASPETSPQVGRASARSTVADGGLPSSSAVADFAGHGKNRPTLSFTAIKVAEFTTPDRRSPGKSDAVEKKLGWAANTMLACGIILGIAAWITAWSRFPFIEKFQQFTFTPLWIAYILVINALTLKRTGRCMMTHESARFAKLFVVSAFFWWFFEYLNRFVQNWYYIGINDFSPCQYFLYATPPFATVLPAVLGTSEYLSSFNWLNKYWQRLPCLKFERPKLLAVAGLLLGCLSLFLIGIFPNFLFPMLWLSPLFIIVPLQKLFNRNTLLDGIHKGDWRLLISLALAGVICGFFWEMWNIYSIAKWKYSVPYVNAFHIFEMPLLGYAGYIPFGLECYCAASLFMEKMKK